MRITLSYDDGAAYAVRDFNAAEAAQLREVVEGALGKQHDLLPLVEGVFADVSTLAAIEARERNDANGDA